MAELSETTLLKLSAQQALLGNVTSNLAAACAQIDASTLHISAYFFATPSDDDFDYINLASTYILADFPDNFVENLKLYTLDQFQHEQSKYLIFLRSDAEATLSNLRAV